jgi:hypothetical protein
MRRFILTAVLAAALGSLLLTGCRTSGGSSVVADRGSPEQIGRPLDPGAVGSAFRVALASQINDLRHKEPVPQVRFGKAASRAGREADFRYQGFMVSEVDFLSAGEEGDQDRVHSVVKLTDSCGRGCALQSLLEYHREGDLLVLEESFARPLFAPVPRVEFYVLRYDLWEQEIGTRQTTWKQLYDFAVANGEDTTVTNLVEREYVILTFVMDRMDPGARLDVVASRSRGGSSPEDSLLTPVYADYQGWRVAVMGGKFSFDRSKRFYVNALITPAPVAGNPAGPAMRVAQFSNS